MLENLKKLDNKYIIDFKENEILINPNQPKEKEYSFRVKIDGEIYYFKGNGCFSYDKSELFCDQIAKQVGLKTINPVPAYFVDEKGNYIDGILSKDYLEERKYAEVISGNKLLKLYADQLTNKEFNFNDFLKNSLDREETQKLRRFNNIQVYKKAIIALQKAINKINPNKKLIADKSILNDLCKYLIFYYVTCNEDCYAHNVEFILSKVDANTVKISLTPLTDNSITLLLKSFKFDYKNLSDDLTDSNLETIVDRVLEKIRMPMSVFEKNIENFRRNGTAIEIAKLLNANPKLYDFYLQLKSIDLNEMINNFKSQNGYNFIDELDIKVASMTYKNSINQLERGLKYCSITNANKIKQPTEKQKE